MKQLLFVTALVLAGCAGQTANQQIEDKPTASPSVEKQAVEKPAAQSKVVDKDIEPIATSGDICPELVGTWYSDTTARMPGVGRQRNIVLIKRKQDGTVDLKIVTVFFGRERIIDSEANATWSCDGSWYREHYDSVDLEFKILSVSDDKNVLRDTHNTLKSVHPKRIYEKKSLPLPKVGDRALRSMKIRKFLELPELPEDLFKHKLP